MLERERERERFLEKDDTGVKQGLSFHAGPRDRLVRSKPDRAVGRAQPVIFWPNQLTKDVPYSASA